MQLPEKEVEKKQVILGLLRPMRITDGNHREYPRGTILRVTAEAAEIIKKRMKGAAVDLTPKLIAVHVRNLFSGK